MGKAEAKIEWPGTAIKIGPKGRPRLHGQSQAPLLVRRWQNGECKGGRLECVKPSGQGILLSCKVGQGLSPLAKEEGRIFHRIQAQYPPT